MFITLTATDGKRPIYIVAEKVVSIFPREDGTTYVNCAHNVIHHVREHHDDIKLLVELTIKEGKENG